MPRLEDMGNDDVIADFERRLAPIRYEREVDASTHFSRDEVRAYIRAKAPRETDFSYPYRDVVRRFPVTWWAEPIVALAAGGYAPGAHGFVSEAFAASPESFASDPAVVARWVDAVDALPWLRAQGAGVREGLLRWARGETPQRWQRVAECLLLLDPTAAPDVVRVMAAREASYDLSSDLAHWVLRDGVLHARYPARTYHLRFADGDLDATSTAHPSWHLAVEPGAHTFGGRVGPWHHVVTFDPMPRDLGVSLPRLMLAIDLHQAYDEGATQYVHHDARGDVQMTPGGATPEQATAAAMPAFSRTRVQLARTPLDYAVQDWGASNGEENLFRLGGVPVFVQDAVYPECEECGVAMQHLLSLDSGLRLEAPAPNGVAWWSWGSGGVANAFWCDGCRVSAWAWACT